MNLKEFLENKPVITNPKLDKELIDCGFKLEEDNKYHTMVLRAYIETEDHTTLKLEIGRNHNYYMDNCYGSHSLKISKIFVNETPNCFTKDSISNIEDLSLEGIFATIKEEVSDYLEFNC